MKNCMISALEKSKEDIKALNKFLFNNPETSYKEVNSCNYICEFLSKHNFKIEKKLS